MPTFKNPVIKGFAPDPSVCAVGDDYYLATSTFAYFPGVPIYHSKDLVNWKQIGNILDREEQLPLSGAEHSGGIFAPCLRYHDGTFYMITTNVTEGGNFIVTAKDPAGPWSNPYYIDHAPGIDPSLFFDDDGKCYYIGTRPNPEGVKYNGDWEVWLQELDLTTMQLSGVSTKLWKGALHTAIWPEAPHIYKIDGYYYLLIAEGGTGYNHACTVARSERVDGPYIGNKNNPILTHRHLGKDFPVHNVGHGDFVQTPDGQWYMTMLASRLFDGYSNLGRETFLAEVVFEDGWPVVNPGVGRLLEEQTHKLPLVPVEETTHFTFESLRPEFMFLRNPVMTHYAFNVGDGRLRLYPTTETIKDLASPTYISVKQQAMDYHLTTRLNLALTSGSEAGLAILQNERYSIRLVVVVEDSQTTVQMLSLIDGEETILNSVPINGDDVTLEIQGAGQRVKGLCRINEETIVVAEDVDSHYLSTEVAGGFVGCTLGIYTTSTNAQPGHVDAHYLSMTKQ
ncbi:xylosidase/arabinosidase [Halolactibacillus miurensis]|uniref:Alpha-N-arabinofuranosidase n=1 Tax=Halolactibacillus miurensis TaxID=306541 RepID=A0A1I6SSZ4_9BACI|nr:glycoside hydrolase family 43 protein [Halolactibacillus miurensis]GEM04216.1 xylosidase/arabinosidase [Halolactibacillus miurensis]SFS80065.1 alpha-N-arabinofuranosidase [Halolactibacillus miurensis]